LPARVSSCKAVETNPPVAVRRRNRGARRVKGADLDRRRRT
jgi:hypothetical protein